MNKPVAKRLRYVTMVILPTNGNLLMVANDEFYSDFSESTKRDRAMHTALYDLLEDSAINGGFDTLRDEDIARQGDMTDRPMIGFGLQYNDDMEFQGATCVWAYNDWVMKDLLEELTERGVVVWHRHPGYAEETRLNELEGYFETKVSSEER